MKSHDVVLGEPEAHRAPRPQQNGIGQMAFRWREPPRPTHTGNELMHVLRGFANLPGNFRQGDKVALVDPLDIRPNVRSPDIADSGQHCVLVGRRHPGELKPHPSIDHTRSRIVAPRLKQRLGMVLGQRGDAGQDQRKIVFPFRHWLFPHGTSP